MNPLAPILLAEDEPDDVFLMKRAFARAELAHPLHVVTDGSQAIQYLKGEGGFANRQQHPLPVLLLLDLKMPFKNGFEVLQWIRQESAHKRLIVVVLTSSSQALDVNRAYEMGANSYLVKPALFDELLELVRRVDAYWFGTNTLPTI
ncbi:MAG: response regulator [Verrucomicrobiota bacterium]|jgi:CheY-like chemotaxis protein